VESLGLQGMTVYLENAKHGEALTSAFAASMEEEYDAIETATPVKFAAGTFKSGQKDGNVVLIGCEEDIALSLGIKLIHGRCIPDKAILDIQNPIVISEHFAKTLYRRSNVVGKQFYVTINGVQERYTVIGVIEDQTAPLNSAFGTYMPELAYIPLQKLSANGQADQIMFSGSINTEEIGTALQNSAQYTWGIQSKLCVQDLSGYREQIEEVTRKTEMFLLLFAAFGIVTAAFAMESSMLSAMQEMRDELLLYRVIGFRRIDIVRFCMVSAGLICFAGSTVGVILAFFVIRFVQSTLISAFIFQLKHLITVLIVSVILSLLAGSLPAFHILSVIKKELYDQK
ncbi:MAG: ABC transporter permease, partial [Christensenellaceae bacterium]|nr:ABC transporter permease [Christensenellaceae bacterium]